MKIYQFILNLFVFLVVGYLAIGSLPVNAASQTTGELIIGHLQAGAGEDGAGLPAPQDPRQVAATIIRSALGILGILFLGLIIYAGFLWMTAGGNEENVKKAKGYIFNAIIGLIIIFSAYSITFFVFRLGLSSSGNACNSDNDCKQKINSGAGPNVQVEKCSKYGTCVSSFWCESLSDCSNLPGDYVCRNGGCTTAEDAGDYFD
ncbi:MAG: pilin [Candidatus Magasanikbacteria bacterium]